MEQIIAFINSIAGLLAAIAALSSGVAAIVGAFRKWLERRRRAIMKASLAEKGLWVIGVVFFLVSGSIFGLRAPGTERQPMNVALTTAAWDAFNAKDYSKAIAKAQECIDEFRGSADREQAELEKQKVPLPPKGKVTDAEKQAILVRGLLNDVATCYFIIGSSAEYLGRIDLAREAYGRAAKYTYARTWDPGGWFWSPAEAAGDRLMNLR